jgi:hypothetical protein
MPCTKNRDVLNKIPRFGSQSIQRLRLASIRLVGVPRGGQVGLLTCAKRMAKHAMWKNILLP